MTLSVLMFCSQFRPAVGGAERQAEILASALVRAGCRVVIVTPRIDPDSPEFEEFDGVRVERFHLNDLSRRYALPGIAFANIPYILWQVAKAVGARLGGVDVIHCHIGGLQTAGAALAGRKAGIPVLVTAHTASWHSDLGNVGKGSRSGRFVARIVRAVIRQWVAISVAVESELVNAGVSPKCITKIPNGVELLGALPDLKNERRVTRFLYLGRMATTAERDVPTLIAAFERIAKANPEVELALVGGGDLFDQTRSLVEATSVSTRIHMPGFDEPAKWLAWADCFVLPSRYEGLSLALLEAMAARLPCIANDIPPNREVLADGAAGVLVPVGDEDSLFQALSRMSNDADFAKTMSLAAFERVSNNYGIDVVANKYISLYKVIDK
jgi:glycosyltransferase involved in cell wall biosynthesis